MAHTWGEGDCLEPLPGCVLARLLLQQCGVVTAPPSHAHTHVAVLHTQAVAISEVLEREQLVVAFVARRHLEGRRHLLVSLEHVQAQVGAILTDLRSQGSLFT